MFSGNTVGAAVYYLTRHCRTVRSKVLNFGTLGGLYIELDESHSAFHRTSVSNIYLLETARKQIWKGPHFIQEGDISSKDTMSPGHLILDQNVMGTFCPAWDMSPDISSQDKISGDILVRGKFKGLLQCSSGIFVWTRPWRIVLLKWHIMLLAVLDILPNYAKIMLEFPSYAPYFRNHARKMT